MDTAIATYNKITSLENIKVARFDVSKRYTKPHRHNKYLELVFFSKGSGFHYMDLKSYAIKPPVVFLIKKGEVHHWEIDSKPKGYVIIIKEAFLEKTLDKHINTLLFKLDSKQKINIPEKDLTIRKLFKILCQEANQENAQQDIVEGLLKALISKIASYSSLDGIKMNTVDTATRFLDILSKTLKNNVGFYAELLNVTPQNLNQICQKSYNKTASLVIADFLIKEAKRLLVYTSKSVSEIAFHFDFKDVSHFIKYFKRHTGHTPLQFKNNH
ncbi:AraC family transcriptional regulator [Snuella sedimenti]|uniref:Helix-turn-helix domain-containing protein n=1 Tax=Snuella sedimenti TaxID=2798802 RepID=A0A8J7LU54_9FLAO|nr:helix-turn-helix transcriptional regulator [Snuella sedimenti]MBJ6369246.1 helix-turn-helix domain-containing protein [Snuella sedimenti]